MKKVIGIILIICLLLLIPTGKKVNATEYDYVDPDQEFRAVWVTPLGGDSNLVTYNSEASFKSNCEYIFTIMEENNLNALIYHVRTHNNALYKSNLNPVATYWSNVNFNSFDPLEWLISECHKRGYEFHAWLNPYRCGSNHVGSYNNLNPASSAANTLTYNSNTILNPGLPVVREFIRDTVLEIVENYDVDAIHFDDYFYMNMGANGALTGETTILNEADQTTYETYIDNNPGCGFSKNSTNNKADWRRLQVDNLIEMLDEALDTYNTTNHKYVQLGIAPTGVYQNGTGTVTYDGNGLPITTGSKTTGQTHYSSYLFCDTLKWCKEGWIDYILPQTYWATNHTACPYETLVSWWAACVKNLPVNFYSGIGLYMADEASNTKNWKDDMDELYNQLDYLSTLANCSGASIYNFANLRKHHDGTASNAATQVENLGTHAWTRRVVQAELKSFTKVNLGEVSNFHVNNKVLTWDALDNTKFYCIYRNSSDVTFASSELVAVVGNTITTWTDTANGNYNYGIKALSYTNTLGAPTLESGTRIEMTNGAAMRTEGSRPGLKFTATITEQPLISTRGFFVIIGTYTKNEIVSAVNSGADEINSHKLVKSAVSGTDNDISVVIYNIDSENYTTNITAIAYIEKASGDYIFSNVVTRNLRTVAISAYQNGNRSELVVSVYNTHRYMTLSDIEDDFFNDFNAYAGTSVNKSTFGESNRDALCEFMNTSSYANKWNWFFSEICSLRHTYEAEIEEYATSNYNGYIANINKSSFTPFMERILAGDTTVSDSGKRLWAHEIHALFNLTCENYYNAHTLDWGGAYANDAINALISSGNE